MPMISVIFDVASYSIILIGLKYILKCVL